MLKAAIEKIQSMSAPTLHTIGNATFSITGENNVKELQSEIFTASTLELHSLDALVKMIRTEGLNMHDAPIYINIPDHLMVECFISPCPEARYIRPTLYRVLATDVPGFDGGNTMGFETAMIAIRTRFQKSIDTDYALKLLSDITCGSKVTFNDNGIATSVITKTGVSLQSNEAIRPILSLCPYRTFQEVAQPSSEFLIRVSERVITFTEADGGMWKLTARETVKAYFDEHLAPEIEAGTVVVAL